MIGVALSEQKSVEIARLYQQGMSQMDVARHLGVSRGAVRYHLRYQRVAVRTDRFLHMDIDAVVRAYLGGESSESIARRMGVSSSTIRSRLHARGVRRRVPTTGPLDPEDIVRAYDAGMTLSTIARARHTSERRVSAMLRDRGVVLRRGRRCAHGVADRDRLRIEHAEQRRRALHARLDDPQVAPLVRALACTLSMMTRIAPRDTPSGDIVAAALLYVRQGGAPESDYPIAV